MMLQDRLSCTIRTRPYVAGFFPLEPQEQEYKLRLGVLSMFNTRREPYIEHVYNNDSSVYTENDDEEERAAAQR